MKINPLVSVIIPAFNAQDLISETIDSILAQTYNNIEIIVVDDGSTDQTAKVVAGYGSKIHYFYQNNSGGCAVPRNTGITHSTGDYLCFMDADDLMTPDRISRQVDFMERNPNVGIVFCDYQNFKDEKTYSNSHFQTCPKLWPLIKDKDELILSDACNHLVQENFGCGGALFIRRSMLNFEPGFEPVLTSCEDFHFYFRLARHSLVGAINEVGFLRRLHGNNMSGNKVRMHSEGIRSRTLLRDSEKNVRVKAYLNRYIADGYEGLGRCYANQGKFVLAIKNYWQTIICDFSWAKIRPFCKNILRTILLLIGVHKNSDQ